MNFLTVVDQTGGRICRGPVVGATTLMLTGQPSRFGGRTAPFLVPPWSLGGHQRMRLSDGRHWGNYRVRYLFSVLMQCFGDGFVKTHRMTGRFNRCRLGTELKSGGAKALFQLDASFRSRQVAGTVSQGTCAAREVDHSKRVCGTASERIEHLR